MNRTLIMLVLVFGGIGLWFYLLLGTDSYNGRNEETGSETVIIEMEAETDATTTANTSNEPPPTAPPQTDAGMEFPTLEE